MNIELENTFIDDCFILHDTVLKDNRGSFFESFNKKSFQKKSGLFVDFVQDNQSISKLKGTLRGLHFQNGEFSQAKLIRVLRGTILNVGVDLREKSKTFGKHISVILSDSNGKQFFMPRGFAHGFIVLSSGANVFWKCDNLFNKESQSGIVFNDFDLAIDWQFNKKDIILSEKDRALPLLRDCGNLFF